MVVDDEEFCIAALKSMLQRLGVDTDHHVDFCINGQEAVETYKNSLQVGLQYKLIFTDFNMPIMDGVMATKKIREIIGEDVKTEKDSQLHIIGVSGYVQEEYKQQGLDAGMQEILSKPLYFDVLKEVLQRHNIISGK